MNPSWLSSPRNGGYHIAVMDLKRGRRAGAHQRFGRRIAELRAQWRRHSLRQPRQGPRRAGAGERRRTRATAARDQRGGGCKSRLGRRFDTLSTSRLEPGRRLPMKRMLSIAVLLAGVALFAGCPKKAGIKSAPVAGSQTTGASPRAAAVNHRAPPAVPARRRSERSGTRPQHRDRPDMPARSSISISTNRRSGPSMPIS